MHSVENLTHLYRARRFWHTPELNQAIDKIIKHFGDRASIPPEFITEFMHGIKRHGLSEKEGWNVWYELCPVIKVTALTVVVFSRPVPDELLSGLFVGRKSSFYSGGKFAVDKPELQRDGKAYHSRHGEYFYIAVPNVAIALVERKELLEVLS